MTVALVIAPASFHQLAEAGDRTARQAAFAELMIAAGCLPLALAIGASVVVATGGSLGAQTALGAGAAATILALFLWYGIEVMVKRPSSPAPSAPPPTPGSSLKDRVADLMTETRIVLPGVQALLGFQFAAYLTDVFPKLAPDARLMHGVSLAFLLISMILLMTPAPFHRLAENGEDSERTCRIGAACIAAALASLAIGLAADFYVAISVVTRRANLALAGGGLAAATSAVLWFAYPLLARSASTHPSPSNVRRPPSHA